MICYKNELVEYRAITIPRHPILVELLQWWHDKHPNKTIITETWRPALHPGDVHSVKPYRAIDLRSWVFSAPETVAKMVNDAWQYDPERPRMKCCIYHSYRGGGKHFHLQVHPRTLYIGGE